MKNKILWVLSLLFFSSHIYAETEKQSYGVLVLAGQNSRAIRAYYYDERLPRPAGFSEYISYDIGQPYDKNAPDAPAVYKGNDALFKATNWGAGVQCVECIVQDKHIDPAVINIGFYMAGPKNSKGELCRGTAECNTYKIASGQYDKYLNDFARWAKNTDALILLRIGYEFDGPWNNYDPDQYKAAFKYIVNYLNRKKVDNIEYVYHSSGIASKKDIEKYFPSGDGFSDVYVDWIGYSYFSTDPDSRGTNDLEFARNKNLPVFIGEAAPHTGDCKDQINISVNPEAAIKWIDNFVSHIEKNNDVIKAIAYINANWADKNYSPMWTEQDDQDCNGFFSRSNSRLNDNDRVIRYWADKISSPLFVNRNRAGEWLKMHRGSYE